ncbi:MAG: TolC family protein [Desulfitobacteriaceae bacterium]
MLKKWKVAAVIATGLVILQISGAAADNAASFSVDQIVQLSKQNNLDDKITDYNQGLIKLRQAYTPSPFAMGGWSSTYALSVAPLINAAQQKASDYATLNTKLQRELNYYNAAYTYWLLEKSAVVSAKNLNLATQERDTTQKKLDAGLASQNDLLQSEVSLNTATNANQAAKLAMEMQQYKINQLIGDALIIPIDVSDLQLTYLSPDDLNVNSVVEDLTNNHQSLASIQTSLTAYQTASSIVAKQTDSNVQVQVQGLTDYYQKEIVGTQMQLQKQQQVLEFLSRSYIDRLNNAADAIKLDQENLDKTQQVYDNSAKLYEVGMITFSDLEKIRLNLLNVNLALYSAEKNYMSLNQEFRLVKQGCLPAQG